MKKIKKLSLNKTTIARLNYQEKSNLRGGATINQGCPPGGTIPYTVCRCGPKPFLTEGDNESCRPCTTYINYW